MQTERVILQPEDIDENVIRRAGSLIAAGELVAFPTETVYGLGGDAFDEKAAEKIYAAKGRPSDNPLIVHIARLEDLAKIAEEVPQRAAILAEAFWPGPLTMILKKNKRIPDATTGGLDTVAVRMPNHPVALALIDRSGCPIAAPSANRSGRPSPTEADHVEEDLSGRISMILDGGSVGIGIESTIVDLTESKPMILRPGYVTAEMIEGILEEEVQLDPGLIAEDDSKKPKAPGMKYRHYAPKARMAIVEGNPDQVTEYINAKAAEQIKRGKRAAVIASDESRERYRFGTVLSLGQRSEEESIALGLYGVLRECDSLGVDVIYSESFSTPRMGQAIMNRLLKAAGHLVIQV